MRNLRQIFRKKQHKILSPIEGIMVTYLCDLPEWIEFETNYPVKPYFIDIALVEHKVGMEIDGWQYHTSEEQIAYDKQRDKFLVTVEGWTIERIPAWFVSRHPDLSLLAMLRHIPEIQETPLYKRLQQSLIQYNIREAGNEGTYLPVPEDDINRCTH